VKSFKSRAPYIVPREKKISLPLSLLNITAAGGPATFVAGPPAAVILSIGNYIRECTDIGCKVIESVKIHTPPPLILKNNRFRYDAKIKSTTFLAKPLHAGQN